MYREIKLDTPTGEVRTVPMLANAATPIRFKQLFKKDILSGLVDKDGNYDTDVISKLAYLMSQQAAKVDINTLNFDKYVDWLEDFDSMAFMDNVDQILDVYIRSKENTSKEKKPSARHQER